MDQEDITIQPARGQLHIGLYDHWVKERAPKEFRRSDISGQSSGVFAALVRRARRQQKHQSTMQIFSASLADIEKALAPKKRTDPREKLPEHYHEFLPVFDRNQADQLPPH